MKKFEFRVLCITILGLCLLVISMGMRIESLQDELDTKQRHSKTSTEDVPTVSDSLSDGSYCCMERLR